jgi:hypothetical protein
MISHKFGLSAYDKTVKGMLLQIFLLNGSLITPGLRPFGTKCSRWETGKQMEEPSLNTRKAKEVE